MTVICASWARFDGLVADEAEDELVIGFVEAGGLEQVGLLDGADDVGDGDAARR